jgi:predicted phosphoribosyltransferase
MKPLSLEERLLYDLEQGWITAEELKEVLKQRAAFNRRRKTIEKKYHGKVVAVADGKLFVGNTVHEVLNAAKQAVPDKPAYFEPVGFDLLH